MLCTYRAIRLKNNGSPGPDCIPAEFYKVTANLISFPLSVIYNLSLQLGNLPALFVLFVNDICDLASLGVTIKLFADDTKLYCVFDNVMSPDCYSLVCQLYLPGQTTGNLNWHH